MERSHAELWSSPAAAGAVALVLALLVTSMPVREWDAGPASWPGDVDAARAFLQAVATGVITVLTFSFSVTLVALQLASQQFSPRLLRDFMRDRPTKATLAVLMATAVSSLAVLRSLDAEHRVPDVAMLVCSALTLGSLVALVLFLSHIMRRLRAESMMVAIHSEAREAVRSFYPAYGDHRRVVPRDEALPLAAAACVSATRSGFVRAVDVSALVEAARRHDVVVRMEARPGDHIMRGTPIAAVWSPLPSAGDPQPPVDPTTPEVGDDLHDAILATVETGYERTIEQDAAFGFRQLVDMAVKAVSPSVNDPATAAHAIGYMGDLLVELEGRELGPTLHLDEDGRGRAIVQDRDLRYYLDLACGQVRRYGGKEPTILTSLLQMLRDVAASARDDSQRNEVRRQTELVVASADVELLDADRRSIDELARRVELAAQGRNLEAYRDRSGDTRSM